MADELKKTSEEANGTPQGGQPSGQSSAATPAPDAGPERTLVMDASPDKTMVITDEQVDKTMVITDEQVDRTMVIGDDDPDRTIVLNEANGVTRAKAHAGGARSVFDDTRARIQTILHNPTSILSAFTGTGKRDVGKKIDKLDRHRERAGVDRIEESQAHLNDLEDRFEIERKLAEGSRYVVSVGEDLGLERQVAIYSLRDEKLLDPNERSSFVAEAEISAQLDHPSVLPVYSVSRDYRGGLHSAVKLTDGTDLRKYLNRVVSHYRSDGFHAAEETAALAFRLELILGISDGLVYAHSRGVVHANLHPQNILIGEYHEVYIKGWGFAQIASGGDISPADPAAQPPQTSHKKGKVPELTDPRFVAPELVSGADPSVRSDVYALGMMLYETVTLHAPFQDNSAPEVLEHLRNGETPPIEHRFGGAIDPDMRAIIQKAIAPDPEKRYPTINDLAEDIRRFLHSEEVSVRRISLSKRFAKLIRAHHRGMFFCFLTLIVLLGAIFAYNILNDVRRARISYLDDHVLGRAQASCRKTAHELNLQAEKFNGMLLSIKAETEFLLSNHLKNDIMTNRYLVPPDKAAGAIQAEYSASYGDNVSFRKIESGRAEDLDDPKFIRLGLIQPTLFRYMLLAPLNAYVTKEAQDKQIRRLTQDDCPIYRFQILLADGSSLYYPYTEKPEPPHYPDSAKPENQPPRETDWYRHAVAARNKTAFWDLPVKLNDGRVVLPVSISLGTADKPEGAAAVLVSGRYIDRILSNAENRPFGMEAQYFISNDGDIKMQRIFKNGPDKTPDVGLEQGRYPDPWLTDWLKEHEKQNREFGAVIRKDHVFCCAFVPAMDGWYIEIIRLRDFLRGIAPEAKGGLK